MSDPRKFISIVQSMSGLDESITFRQNDKTLVTTSRPQAVRAIKNYDKLIEYCETTADNLDECLRLMTDQTTGDYYIMKGQVELTRRYIKNLKEGEV